METQLSDETAKDIMDLIADPKLDVKKGVLGVILQYANTAVNRTKFIDTDIIKYLLRYVFEDHLETLALSNLISFAEDQEFVEKIIELKGIDRIIDNLKETILIQKKKIDEKLALIIELSLMTLVNLTLYQNAVYEFLHFKEENHEGINFKILLELFLKQEYDDNFHMFGNILANLSANELVRALLNREEYKFLRRILPQAMHPNTPRRMGILKTIKNFLFDLDENLLLKLILEDNFIDKLINLSINLILNCNKYKTEKNQQHLNGLKSNFEINIQCTEQEIEEQIEAIIDILFLIAKNKNSKENLKLDKQNFQKIYLIVEDFINEETLQKIKGISEVFQF